MNDGGVSSSATSASIFERIASQSVQAERTSPSTETMPSPKALRRAGSISRSTSTWISDSGLPSDAGRSERLEIAVARRASW